MNINIVLSVFLVILHQNISNMDNKITIESLKQIFYSQNYFDRYCDYLQRRDFEDVDNDRLNKALNLALTDSDGTNYYGSYFGRDYDKTKKEFGSFLRHSIKVSESQKWASVEEFFDIIDNAGALGELDSLNKHILSLLKFIKTDEPKNAYETKQMSEDTIIKLIVKHFWKENPVEKIKGDFLSPIFYSKDAKLMYLDRDGNLKEDSADKRKKYQRVKRPFESANEILEKATYDALITITEDRLIDNGLDEDFKQVINYLKAIKKIRNNQAHHIDNTVKQGANRVFEFCLFVYIHLVLTLRQTLILRGKGEYHQLKPTKFYVYIENPIPNLDIKLFKIVNNDEIEISKNIEECNNKTIVFNIEHYVKYKLVVNERREANAEFVYNSFSPHAYIHPMGEPVIRSGDEDTSCDNSIRFEELLSQMVGIGNKIDNNTATLTWIGKMVNDIKVSSLIAAAGILMIIVILICGMFYFKTSHIDTQRPQISYDNNKEVHSIISLGDSLLKVAIWKQDFRLCEQARESYREAISQLRSLAEQQNSSACIDLCHLYISGKGCYDLDSAFYYAQKKEVREIKEGQGLYAYLLFKRGEIELARKELSRAIDSQETYMRLTKALYEIYNAVTKSSSLVVSEQICESAFQSLQNINNDDVKYEKAMLSLWGVRNNEDTDFILHPNFGEGYNALFALANSNPYALLALGDIHNLMGDANGGLNYHCAAFYCGIQQKAAIAINLSMLLNSDIFSLTELGRTMKEKMTGMANVIGGVGGLMSDYIHYVENKDYDLAVETADSLYVLTHNTKKNDVSISDTSFVSSIQITSRLMTRNPEDFSRAVQLAMKRDNCTDSIAVADYLKGVSLAKGYGCEKNIGKSDILITSSARRGTYTESLVTNIKRCPPVLGTNDESNLLLNFYFNPDLLKKSPKLASAVAEFFFTNDEKYLYEYQVGEKIIPYLPQEWLLMNKFMLILMDRGKNQLLLSNSNSTDIKGLTYINDYICLSMNNGQSLLAQNGCLAYKIFSSIANIQKNINAYDKFSIDPPKFQGDINDKNLDISEIAKYNAIKNPMPLYSDYAY